MTKGDIMQNVVKRIYDYSLEEIMGMRFERYSRSIILDRALPDVRDGLKPVQRRILYGMYKEKHTHNKPYVKSARCVGDIMGKYHPHGDSSIYDAMVRMSQWWKQNAILIDMQGNNGSMDGDGAAAMRYTEARLSQIAGELISKDLDKGTVSMAPNFDDTLEEPTVLPARFPNLLVNGANGISAGYATNIPPHNLSEIIDATIKRIDSPSCNLETILKIVGGPDFPTGGIIYGKKGIIDAFTCGRGKIIVRSKYSIQKNKGKEQILITEIPFDVNKQALVAKINEIRIDKKVDGITEARDESDREDSVRIVIDLKKDANKDLILAYLLKNTDLQISYNYNMVAIVNRRPMTLGILKILDAYIAHQKEVITKRTQFDLAHAKDQMHIVEGLIKALSILDKVIQTIRGSKNKINAKENLVKEYQFTERQAEAIVTLQLYRLTNTDVTELMNEQMNLKKIIEGLDALLQDENKMKNRMKEELREIKKQYGTARKTEIKEEIEEIKIEKEKLITKEDVIVVITKEGYIKRVSTRSYQKEENTLLKDTDYVIGLYEMNTIDTLLIFTNKGNYLYIPVHTIPDLKWKELGKHISNIIPVGTEEVVIGCYPVSNFEVDACITILTKNGMIKRSKLSDFKVNRYSKPLVAMKLKEDDEVLYTSSNDGDILIVTKRGYGLCYNIKEVPVTGLKSSGVKAISLKDDIVATAALLTPNIEYIALITSKGTGKRMKASELERTTRARRGLLMIREVKTNPYEIIKVLAIEHKNMIGIKTKDDMLEIKPTELSISDRYSVGTTLFRNEILDCFVCIKEPIGKTFIQIEEMETLDVDLKASDEEALKKVDEKIYTIEDFLNEIEENN